MKFFERLKQSVFLFKILSMLMVVCSVPNSYGESTAYALINTNVFNGIDNHILKNATILVENGKIREISGAEHTPPDGFTVVLVEMVAVAAVSLLVLAVGFAAYQRQVDRLVDWALRTNGNLVLSLATLVMVPLLLVVM